MKLIFFAMQLSELSNSDLLQWFYFYDRQIQILEDNHEEIQDNDNIELLESQSTLDDLGIKAVLISQELHSRSRNIDFGIDYDALGDIEIEDE